MPNREPHWSRPGPAWPRRFAAPRAVLLLVALGLAATTLAAMWSMNRAVERDARELASKGELLVFETASLLDEVGMQVTATGAFFRASVHVTPFEYATFAGDLGLIPGVVGTAYVPVVSDEDLDSWLERTRREVPNLQVFEFDEEMQPITIQDRDVRYPLLYFAPVDRFQALAGLDLGYREELLPELESALGNDGVTMTSFLELGLPAPLDDEDQFVVGMPIRNSESGELEALAVSVADLELLLDMNLSPEVTDGVDWVIRDLGGTTAAEPAGEGEWRDTLTFGHRTWEVTATLSTSTFGWTRILYPVGAGLLITLLLAYAGRLATARVQTRREVESLEAINRGKDEFLAAVSHRLRTPLTSVVGFSEVLRDSGQSFTERDRQELLSTISIQAIELGHLFDNLLTVTRDADQTAFTPCRVHLTREAHTVLDTADPARRARVRLVATDADVAAAGDPGLVRQILRNLIANAAEHGENVELSIAEEGLVARVTVRDDGPGIAEDRGRDVFGLYDHSSGNGQPHSTGVGLFVSRRLARRMSGDLTYRRRHGWTEFELSLPALPAAISIEPLQSAAPPSPN